MYKGEDHMLYQKKSKIYKRLLLMVLSAIMICVVLCSGAVYLYLKPLIENSLVEKNRTMILKMAEQVSNSLEEISIELYDVEVSEKRGDTVLDVYKRQFGFRRMERKGDMDFSVNGRPLKLWGANLAHADTLTGCYGRVKEKLYGLLDLAEMGNFNCLRIWGESEILDDDFYSACDRRGILLWQDFYLGFHMYSEEEEMLSMCRQEAETLVKRLKHHPSILLWCGGNEMYWSRDMQYKGEYCFGEKIFCEVFQNVCRKLDPGRYYHRTSPFGGDFSNDPKGGDTHGYTHLWLPDRHGPQ